jgi:hypothetical protein
MLIKLSTWLYLEIRMQGEVTVFLTQYCAGGKIEKTEMGGPCGAYGRGESVGGEARGKEAIGETQTWMGG